MAYNTLPPPLPTIPGLRRKIFQRYQYNAPTIHYDVQHLASNALFGKMIHMYDEKGCNASLESFLSRTTSQVWGTSLSNGLGHIAQGIRDIEGNVVVNYIKKSEVLLDRKVTYANMICSYIPLKSDSYSNNLMQKFLWEIGGEIVMIC